MWVPHIFCVLSLTRDGDLVIVTVFRVAIILEITSRDCHFREARVTNMCHALHIEVKIKICHCPRSAMVARSFPIT